MARQHRGNKPEGGKGAVRLAAAGAALALLLAGCAQAPVKQEAGAPAKPKAQAQTQGKGKSQAKAAPAKGQAEAKAPAEANAGTETKAPARKQAEQGQAKKVQAPAEPRPPSAVELRQAVEAMLAHPRTLFVRSLGNVYEFFVGGTLDARYSPDQGTLTLTGQGEAAGRSCILSRDGGLKAEGGEAAAVCRGLLDALRRLLKEGG